MSTDKYSIHTLQQLREIIPAPAALLDKRILSALDAHCCNLINQSALVAVGCFNSPAFTEGQIDVLALSAHKLTIWSATSITITLNESDKINSHYPGQPGSLYFILPGIGYGLRVNGWLTREQGNLLSLEVTAAYLQCTRAKVRANFWQAPERKPPTALEAKQFVTQASYLLMLTRNAQGDTELSPRGDPHGFVQQQDDGTLILPERPGNKVAVSLRNILETNTLSLLFFIPGSFQLLQVSGHATLSVKPELLTAMAVNGKAPKLAIIIKPSASRLISSAELAASDIWDSNTHIHQKSLPSFAKMMGEHMSGKGIKGKLSSALVDVVVKKDLKNLY